MPEKYIVDWHSALVSGLKIELRDYAHLLSFSQEYVLNSGPRRIDCLITKENVQAHIDTPIAAFFRHYNLVDYKGPDESMSTPNFYKALSYACSLPDFLHSSPDFDDLTLTLISHKYPRSLARHFRTKYSKILEKIVPEVYHIDIGILPIQVIVLPQLQPNQYLWLRCLTNQIDASLPLSNLSAAYKQHEDDPVYQNFMNAFIHANLVSKEGEVIMCEALYDLFADELIKNKELGERLGEKRGKETGQKMGQSRILKLVSNLVSENRNDDILKITQDSEYCSQLLTEYHL